MVFLILKTSQNKYIWVELLVWGVHKGDTTLIWGYAESYNSDLGVREYQKVENPWTTVIKVKLWLILVFKISNEVRFYNTFISIKYSS